MNQETRTWSRTSVLLVGAMIAAACSGEDGSPREPSEPTVADVDVANAGALRLTRPRLPIREQLDHFPGPETTAGDQLAWYWDHPNVAYIIRGSVHATEGYARSAPGDIWTRCQVEVTRAFKGDAPSHVRFEAAGGTFDGTTAWSSFHTDCEVGDDGIFILYDAGDRLVAAGSKDISAKFARTIEGREPARAEWAEAVVKFLENASEGGPR